MFPVRTTARFDVSVRRIAQNLYFSGIEDPDQGLKASLVVALVNVRAFPEAYPRTGKATLRLRIPFDSPRGIVRIRRRAGRAARYPLRPFDANGALAERVIGRSVPSRL